MLAVMILDSERLLSPAVTTATTRSVQQISFVKEQHPMLMLKHIGSMFGSNLWSNYKQLSKNQELTMPAYSAQVPQMEDGTLEIDAETLLKKTPLPKVGISTPWNCLKKERFLAKKIEVWRMSSKKLGKGMQDSISTKYQDYHRLSLIYEYNILVCKCFFWLNCIVDYNCNVLECFLSECVGVFPCWSARQRLNFPASTWCRHQAVPTVRFIGSTR